MHIFSNLFIILTAFFESISSENKIKSNVKGVAIQILYALVFSLVFGVLLGFIVITALGTIFGIEYVTFINLIIMPIFIFIILVWIIVSNYKNKEYRLSKCFLKLYFLVLMINPIKKIKQSIIYTFVMPVILFAVSLVFLSSVAIDTSKYLGAAGIIFIIAFFVSLLLYSESQSNKLERCLRQFAIWFIIFLGFAVLNIYQYSIYLSSDLNRDQILSLLISILSFAFTMTTIADKTRSLYEEANKKYKVKINEIMYNLKQEYNYKKYVQAIEKEKNDLLQGIGQMKNQWKVGNKIMVIKSILLVALLEILLIFMLFKQKLVDNFMNMLMKDVTNIWISIFGGNRKLASGIFLIILSIVFLSITIRNTVKNFKVSTCKVKLGYINKILLILIIIVTVTSSLVSGAAIIVTKYITFPLVILLVFGVIIQDKVFKE